MVVINISSDGQLNITSSGCVVIHYYINYANGSQGVIYFVVHSNPYFWCFQMRPQIKIVYLKKLVVQSIPHLCTQVTIHMQKWMQFDQENHRDLSSRGESRREESRKRQHLYSLEAGLSSGGLLETQICAVVVAPILGAMHLRHQHRCILTQSSAAAVYYYCAKIRTSSMFIVLYYINITLALVLRNLAVVLQQ